MGNLFEFSVQAHRIDEQLAVVEVQGEMDMHTSPRAKAVMIELIEQGCSHLLINLHRTVYIDSTGLGTLVGLMRRAREQGGEVRLIAPSPQVRRLLEITRLTNAFAIDRSEEEAVEHLTEEETTH
ncbi:MAG: STAS domain-containing protein [Armatimonadota bacterium]